MAFCSMCGAQLEPDTRFCANCGAAVASAPVTADYVRTVEAKPELSTKDKVFGYVGMGLGIGSLVLAVFGILYTLIFAFSEPAAAFGASIGFGIFSLPMGIVGRKFSGQSMEAGNESNACSVGSKLGLAGLIVSAVMLFVGFIALIAAVA